MDGIEQFIKELHSNYKLIRGNAMKNSFKIFTLISMIVVLISYCSEDKNPLPSVSHPEEWNTVQSADFHGKKVLEMNKVLAEKKVLAAGYESCKSCHGVDFKGGKSGVSCNDCHSTFPHPDEWSLIGNDNSHGEFIKENMGAIENCKKCHGFDLRGGTSGVSCYDCHAEESLP
jgi:hypothetical protein